MNNCSLADSLFVSYLFEIIKTYNFYHIMKNKTKIFRRNKLKDFMFFVVSLIFVAASYLILEKNPLMGYLGISFFGIGSILFLIQLLTNISYIKLSEEGVEEKNLFRTKNYKWSEVEHFRQVNFRGNKSIVFDYTKEYKKAKVNKKTFKFLLEKQQSITSSHNIKTDELVKLMINYKRNSK